MFSDSEFALDYRMRREIFEKLVELLNHRLKKIEKMSKRGGRETVSPEARLKILSRIMASESVYGCMAYFVVRRSTGYQLLKETHDVLNDVLKLPELLEDFDGLERVSDDFQTSCSTPNHLPGDDGALDGMAIKIKKPAKHEHPTTHDCRKRFDALPV